MLLIAVIIVVKLWCLCTKGDALTKKYKHTHLKQTNKQANKQTLYVQLLLDSRPLALNPLQSTRKIQDYLWCFLKLSARDAFVAFPAPSHFRTSRRLLTPAHQKYCMVSLCTLHPRQNMADLVNKIHHHTTRHNGGKPTDTVSIVNHAPWVASQARCTRAHTQKTTASGNQSENSSYGLSNFLQPPLAKIRVQFFSFFKTKNVIYPGGDSCHPISCHPIS